MARPPRNRKPSTTRSLRGLAMALLGFLGACTAPGQDLHLAPLYTHMSLAGGDSAIEALGGAALARWDQETKRLDYWALRPLVSWQRQGEGRSFAWLLPPLGQRFERPEETVHQFLPILRHARQYPEGQPSSYQFLMLPGIYLARDADGDKKSAFFIFYGDTENFLSFDSASWILFPFYARFERAGRTTHNVLFPVIQWSEGTGGKSWRLWPLYGDQGFEGRYRRKFFLWPFFMWQTNDLRKDEELHQKTYFFWPFFGLTEREESRAWTVLWPFFGYTKDDRSGFWAWDGPWPFVLFQGGDPDGPCASGWSLSTPTTRAKAWNPLGICGHSSTPARKPTRATTARVSRSSHFCTPGTARIQPAASLLGASSGPWCATLGMKPGTRK